MSLLDDALKAAGATGATVDPTSTGPRVTASADVTLAGVDGQVQVRLAKTWALNAWGNATWSGNRSAGISIKGSL